MRQIRETLTPREQQEQDYQKEMVRLQMQHEKELTAMDIEVRKMEASFSVWLKIPILILSLPIKALLVIPLCIYAVRGKEVPEHLWKLL